MQTRNAFSTQALLIVLVGAAALAAVALLVPDTLVWAVIGAALLVALGMWLGLRAAATRALEKASAATAPAPERAPEPEPARREEPAPPRAEVPEQPPEAAAVQLLAILQREGRLIDFLQEDIKAYDDAQIGAAVRAVHEGCRQVLREHVTLAPVMDEAEGSTVTVEEGFDTRAIRLSGHVEGDPPFTGALKHRGWRVAEIDLPALMQKKDRVVATAEVEVR